MKRGTGSQLTLGFQEATSVASWDGIEPYADYLKAGMILQIKRDMETLRLFPKADNVDFYRERILEYQKACGKS